MTTPQTLSLDGLEWRIYPLRPNEWRWRRVWEAEPPAAAAEGVRAKVPGHAQSALLAAGILPHPYQGLNSRLWEWVSTRDWIYSRSFTVPEEWTSQRLWLRFEAIDGAAHVFLNGQEVGSHDAAFSPAVLEVTGQARPGQENRLLVVVERAPDVQGQIGWTSRERHWRARFAYGWDFGPRLPPVGIWGPVSLRAAGSAAFRELTLHTNLSTDRREAAVSIVSEFTATEPTPAVVVSRLLRQGFPVAEVQDPLTIFPGDTSLVQSLRIPRVELWWPNGTGDQPLYEARIAIQDRQGRFLDFRSFSFGVRSLEMLPNEDAPPDSLPYTLSVNGRRLFMQGWNWAPLDMFYGAIEPERYERFLRLARAAGVNMLRVNGVGILESETFYDLCDRFGILVWQEFPLSGSGIDNAPPDDPEYLRQVQALAAPMVAARRNHPSLAIWCGGNELAGPNREPLGSDHPALAALQQVVTVQDPNRAWLPTSPTGPHFMADPARRGELHDAHGPWLYLGPTEHYPFYDAIDPLLHSEFGCEGAASLDTLYWIADRDPELGIPPLWPPDRANALWFQHGGDWWLHPEKVAELFGHAPDLATYVRQSQFLQAEGLRYGIESNRRRQWRCSGTLPWQFNEPWPNAVGTNAVDYFGRPKAAYWAVRRAYARLHVSLAYRTIDWREASQFRADVWLHNGGEARSLLNVAVTITALDGRVLYQENLAAEAPDNAVECAGDVVWRFPGGFAEVFVIHLEVIDEEGERLAENAYLHSRAPAPIFAPLAGAPAATLAGERGEQLGIRNDSGAPALMVTVEAPEDPDAQIGDSWFVLPARTTRELAVQAEGPLRIRAWNCPEVIV